MIIYNSCEDSSNFLSEKSAFMSKFDDEYYQDCVKVLTSS